MNVTVAVEEVHLGDKISVGGPTREVKSKIEHGPEVELGFDNNYPSFERLKYKRGTLVDIEVSEADLKAYMVYDGTSLRTLGVVPKDVKEQGIVWE